MQISAPRATLTVDAIQAMLNAAVARTKQLKVQVHISIYDASAELVGFISFEGAPRIAVTTANRKAFTAARMGMKTEQWEAYVNSIPAAERKIIDTMQDFIAAKGGYPVIQNGLVLGGIGISGANQEIDADIAEAALKAIGL
jgi:glc operon protein GlcG